MDHCDTCSKLQKELYEARLVIARHEGALSVLRAGMASDRVSYSFLSDTCSRHFDTHVLKGGPRTYATYVRDHVMPGRVVLAKKTVRYISDDGSVVEEPVVDFVGKVLASTRVAADRLYLANRDAFIGDFCRDSDAPAELAKTFANMAMVRNCDRDFCHEVAAIVIKTG